MDPGPAHRFTADENPLLSDSSAVWDELLRAVDPASLLVVIEQRMSAALRRLHAPEDIFQEVLVHAWRDRSQIEWRGLKSFRAWLLTVIENRIREAADTAGAAKRGGRTPPVTLSSLHTPDASGREAAFPAGSTTPSRVAIYKEQAAAMRAALDDLPEDRREVVRLRLFEQCTLDQIAERLGIGVDAVRHRFRKGSETYVHRLRAELASRSRAQSQESAPPPSPDSS